MKAFVVFLLLIPTAIAAGGAVGLALVNLGYWVGERKWAKKTAIIAACLLIPLSLIAAVAVAIWA